MKLSLFPRFGFVHVRAGKLLKVAHDHQVALSGEAVVGAYEDLKDGKTKESPTSDSKGWVTAVVGGLAVELVAVKTGKIIGHSYLTGAAITCNRYTPWGEHWFTDAVCYRQELGDVENAEEAAQRVIAMRFQPEADLVVFQLEHKAFREAAKFIGAWLHAKPDGEELPPLSHDILGVTHAPGKRGNRPHALIHQQAAGRTQDRAASPFQAMLAYDIVDARPAVQGDISVVPEDGTSPVSLDHALENAPSGVGESPDAT